MDDNPESGQDSSYKDTLNPVSTPQKEPSGQTTERIVSPNDSQIQAEEQILAEVDNEDYSEDEDYGQQEVISPT